MAVTGLSDGGRVTAGVVEGESEGELVLVAGLSVESLSTVGELTEAGGWVDDLAPGEVRTDTLLVTYASCSTPPSVASCSLGT